MDKKVVLLAVIVGAVILYWFGIRPENVRKDCNKEAIEESVRTISFEDEPDTDKREALQYKAQENYYTSCLRRNGLSK